VVCELANARKNSFFCLGSTVLLHA
jgi:hypothetical protein